MCIYITSDWPPRLFLVVFVAVDPGLKFMFTLSMNFTDRSDVFADLRVCSYNLFLKLTANSESMYFHVFTMPKYTIVNWLKSEFQYLDHCDHVVDYIGFTFFLAIQVPVLFGIFSPCKTFPALIIVFPLYFNCYFAYQWCYWNFM